MTTTVTDHAPFRADQVGSLLRPPELKTARDQRAKGEISDADLRAVEDRLIRTAVKMQETVGLQGITDGDFRRQSWSSDFLCAIGGVVQAPDGTIWKVATSAKKDTGPDTRQVDHDPDEFAA